MNIFLNGGIGDFMAIEACWARPRIGQIHHATRVGKILIPVIQSLKRYAASEHIDHWDYDRDDALQGYHDLAHARRDGLDIPEDVEDRSTLREFALHRPYRGSSFLKQRLAHLPPILPSRYAVIVGTTTMATRQYRMAREFIPSDWEDAIRWLQYRDLSGVVLHPGNAGRVPRHPRMIDLTGRTTLAQSIEVVKSASAYAGIDSWASVLASMVLPDPQDINILSRNSFLYANAARYYPSHTLHDFVADEIRTCAL